MQKYLQGSRWLTFLTILLLIAIFFFSIVDSGNLFAKVPFIATCFFYLWFILAIIFSVVAVKEFVVGWLMSVFSLLIAARIAALQNVYLLATPLMICFGLLFLNFLYCAWQNIKFPNEYKTAIPLAGWQLIFIRLYIGFDFVPHFTEKLFSGLGSFTADVKDFAGLDVIDPSFFVVLAGLCEFGAAIAIGLGIFLRPGAVGAALYLLIASLLGHHYSNGFIWANPGGGWEFATMWMVLILSFAVTGYNEFSIGRRLGDQFKLPKILRKLV